MSTIFAIVWVKTESCFGSSSESVIRLSRVPVWMDRGGRGTFNLGAPCGGDMRTYFEGWDLELDKSIGGQGL